MAVKCLIIFTIVAFLGVVCARELKVASKLKVDPGIFISLETLRRLEAKAKNNTTESINTTPAEDQEVDESVETDVTTTSLPDNEDDPDSNDTDEANDTAQDTVENQTNEPINSNDANDGSVDETTKNPNTTQQHIPQATSKQALLAFQKIQWPVLQYPYNTEQIYQPNPYQQLTFGAVNNQNIGYQQMNPVLFNQQLLSSQLVNPQASFDPNQHYQQTFIVQHPYPVLNQPSNPQMNLISLNPVPMPLPYQQMYQPVVGN